MRFPDGVCVFVPVTGVFAKNGVGREGSVGLVTSPDPADEASARALEPRDAGADVETEMDEAVTIIKETSQSVKAKKLGDGRLFFGAFFDFFSPGSNNPVRAVKDGLTQESEPGWITSR